MPNKLSLTLRAGIIAAILLSCAGLYAQKAAKERPWYAAGLEALGFSVYDAPMALKDFSVKDMDGKAQSLKDLKGKIALINFWATWCPPCRAEMPAIESLWKAMKAKDFYVMGISLSEKPATVATFIKTNGYSYPIFLDQSGSIGSQFNVRSIPTTLVIDKSGKAIATIIGGAPYDSAEALAIFSELASK
jgi:peroxiredoxin